MPDQQSDNDVVGYVQCVSRIFRVHRHHVMLYKLVARKDCFCEQPPPQHVLMRWLEETESNETRASRLTFTRVCSVNQWVRISGLRSSRVYRKQPRERPVWLYVPQTSRAQVWLHPPSPDTRCHPLRCPSWPCYLVSQFRCKPLRSIHADGTLMVLKPISIDSQFLCLSSHLFPDAARLPIASFQTDWVLSNIWIIPTHHSPPYAGIILGGIYSTSSCLSNALLRWDMNDRATVKVDEVCNQSCCQIGQIPSTIHPHSVVRWNLEEALDRANHGSHASSQSLNPSDGIFNLLKKLISTDSQPPVPVQFTEEFIDFPYSAALPPLTSPSTWLSVDDLPTRLMPTINQVNFSDPSDGLQTCLNLPAKSGKMTIHSVNRQVNHLKWSWNCHHQSVSLSGTQLTTLYILVHNFISLEWNEPNKIEHHFRTLSITNTEHTIVLKLTRLSNPFVIKNPNQSDCFYYDIAGNVDESNSIRLTLTGSIAWRWFHTFRLDSTYTLVYETADKNTHRLLRVTPSSVNEFTVVHCEHLLNISQVITLTKNAPHQPELFAKRFNIQALVFYKSLQSDGTWCLWMTEQMDQTDLENIDLSQVLLLQIPVESPWIGSLHCFNGPFAWIRAYELHLIRPHTCLATDGSSSVLLRPHLAASTLSRLELIQRSPSEHVTMCHHPAPPLIETRDECLLCKEFEQYTAAPSRPPMRWLSVLMMETRKSNSGGVFCVRASISKCLEFTCFRISSVETSSSLSTPSPPVLISMRLIITDGSASALVQLGQRPSHLTQQSALPATTQQSASNFIANEHARLLFGLSPSVWTRLCLQLDKLIAQQEQHLGPVFTLTHKSVGGGLLEQTLQIFLTSSPAFQRPHSMHLVSARNNSTAPGSWRTREIRVNVPQSEPRMVRVSQPPLCLYNLIRVEPFSV